MQYRETIERAEALEEAAMMVMEDGQHAADSGDLEGAEAAAVNALVLIRNARMIRSEATTLAARPR